jgi:hypothetical protein
LPSDAIGNLHEILIVGAQLGNLLEFLKDEVAGLTISLRMRSENMIAVFTFSMNFSHPVQCSYRLAFLGTLIQKITSRVSELRLSRAGPLREIHKNGHFL